MLIEQSLIGWKEFELEVMRDLADNVVIICSIENLDPMGIHTGTGPHTTSQLLMSAALFIIDSNKRRIPNPLCDGEVAPTFSAHNQCQSWTSNPHECACQSLQAGQQGLAARVLVARIQQTHWRKDR